MLWLLMFGLDNRLVSGSVVWVVSGVGVIVGWAVGVGVFVERTVVVEVVVGNGVSSQPESQMVPATMEMRTIMKAIRARMTRLSLIQ